MTAMDKAVDAAADRIELSFDYERRLFPRALMGWWRSVVPPAPFIQRILHWAVIWTAILMLTMMLGAAGIEPVFVAAGLVGIAVFVVGFVILQRLRMRRFVNAIGSHWEAAGRTRASFGPDGVVLADQVSRTEMGWAGVDGIVAIRGATVLRSGISMVAVPDAALPAGMTPRAFRERLEGWREG